MLYKAVGKEPNFFYAPLWLFDTIIDSLQWVADTFNSEKFENAAELGRIGKYYAVEDMLTTDPNEKFGTITLQEHYDRIAVEGQEYDPYTTMYVPQNYYFVRIAHVRVVEWALMERIMIPLFCFCFFRSLDHPHPFHSYRPSINWQHKLQVRQSPSIRLILIVSYRILKQYLLSILT